MDDLNLRVPLEQAVVGGPIRFVVPVVNLRVPQPPLRLMVPVASSQLVLVLMAPLMTDPEVMGLYDEPVQRPAIAFQ